MTSVKISGEIGCRIVYHFPMSGHDPHGPGNKSKNPYALRNCIISVLTTAGALVTTQTVALFLDPVGCLIGKYAIS